MKVSMNLAIKFDSIKFPGILAGSAEGAEFSIGGTGEYTLDEVQGLNTMLKESINELLEQLGATFASKSEEPETEVKNEEPSKDVPGDLADEGETYSEYLIRKGLC